MFKLDKKDMDSLIKRTKHPNWNKISFDYVLPGEEYVYSKTKTGKPRWFFELQERGGVPAWINRVNFLEKYQKEKDKEARSQEKVQQLKKLVGLVDEGNQQPAPAPSGFSTPFSISPGPSARGSQVSFISGLSQGSASGISSAGATATPLSQMSGRSGMSSGRASGMSSGSLFGDLFSDPSIQRPTAFRPLSTPPQLTQPVEDFNQVVQPQGPIIRPSSSQPSMLPTLDQMQSEIDATDPNIIDDIKKALDDAGYDPNFQPNIYKLIVERRETTDPNEAIDNLINKGVVLEGKIQGEQKEPEVKFEDVNWNDTKIRNDIGAMLKAYGYRQTEVNKNQIVEYFRANQ